MILIVDMVITCLKKSFEKLYLKNVFEKSRNMYIKVYELDPAHFLSLPGLAWQVCQKKKQI